MNSNRTLINAFGLMSALTVGGCGPSVSSSDPALPINCTGDTCIIGQLEKYQVQVGENYFYRIPIPKGEYLGVSVQPEPSTPLTQLSLSYQVRLSEFFAESGHAQVGKLPGFSGTSRSEGYGGRPAQGQGWSARMGFAPGKNGCVSVGYYIYHLGQTTRYGDFSPFACLPREQWHAVALRAETFPDGDVLLEAAINGKETFSRRFQVTEGQPALRPWIDVYYGGRRPAERDLYVDLDDVVLSE